MTPDERDYRRGYWHGYNDAIDAAQRMDKSGLRLGEILRELCRYFDLHVTAWRYGGGLKSPPEWPGEADGSRYGMPTYRVIRMVKALTFIHPCACGEIHSHGAPMSNRKGSGDGHRVAHCADPTLHPEGYVIVEENFGVRSSPHE